LKQHRIGLDIRMIQNSGIGTYLRGLLSGFKKLGQNEDLALFGAPDFTSDPTLQPLPDPTPGAGKTLFTAPIYSIKEQLQYPARVAQCKLWHAPHYNVPLWKGKTKLVVTIHDIIHWIFRKQVLSPLQTFYAGFMIKKAIKFSDHIIAVSHHTKKDLVEHFHAPSEKITVIHQGVDEAYERLAPRELKPEFEKLRSKYKIPENYFLYVGMIKPHKNVLMLVKLFNRLKQEGKVRAALVIIGRKDKAYPVGYEELASLTTNGDIHYLPVIDPHELMVFYNQALALIHPSLYEGFGLTLLEAMSYGTPVLTTNSSSIPEVVGDAACRVNAADDIAMGAAILKLDQDPGLRESLRQKGFARAKMFRWTETARKTSEIYEKVLTGK